jgi:DNA-binding NtrC family response regulator
MSYAYDESMLTLSSISPGTTGTPDVAASLASAAAPAGKPGPTVLLVDDDSSVRNSVCRVLTAEGLRVVPARGVKDALDYLARNTPDLVITDLCMALLSGWDLIAHLGDHHPALPIVVISALPVRSAIGADRVATAFFQKPLDLEALLVAIQRELNWSRPSERSSLVQR